MKHYIFKSTYFNTVEEDNALKADLLEFALENMDVPSEEDITRAPEHLRLYLKRDREAQLLDAHREANRRYNEEDNVRWDDEKGNLTHGVPTVGAIIAYGDVGRWDGTRRGFKVVGNDLKDILQGFGCDWVEIFVEGGDVKFHGVHHDGQVDLTYRELVEDLACVDDLLERAHCEKITVDEAIAKYTKSLAPIIAKVYGWDLERGAV